MKLLILIFIFAIIFCIYVAYRVSGSDEETEQNKQKIIPVKDFGNLLAHVAGPSGVGKSHIGRTLTAKYRDIHILDLDILTDEIFDEFGDERAREIFPDEFKARIEEFLERSDVPVIFVGFEHFDNGKVFFDLPTKNKFVLLKSTSQIIRQRAARGDAGGNLNIDIICSWIDSTEEQYHFYNQHGYVGIYNYKPVEDLIKKAIKKGENNR